jgi:hypothetical protein
VNEQLPDRELDALVAEKIFNLIENGGLGVSPWDSESGIVNDVDLPLSHYSTDISAAMEMELRIFSDERIRSYVSALRRITEADDIADSINRDWMLIHATPKQRCLAALSAINGDK